MDGLGVRMREWNGKSATWWWWKYPPTGHQTTNWHLEAHGMEGMAWKQWITDMAGMPD